MSAFSLLVSQNVNYFWELQAGNKYRILLRKKGKFLQVKGFMLVRKKIFIWERCKPVSLHMDMRKIQWFCFNEALALKKFLSINQTPSVPMTSLLRYLLKRHVTHNSAASSYEGLKLKPAARTIPFCILTLITPSYTKVPCLTSSSTDHHNFF